MQQSGSKGGVLEHQQTQLALEDRFVVSALQSHINDQVGLAPDTAKTSIPTRAPVLYIKWL